MNMAFWRGRDQEEGSCQSKSLCPLKFKCCPRRNQRRRKSLQGTEASLSWLFRRGDATHRYSLTWKSSGSHQKVLNKG
ncbi:hypothetical protein Y1Q_0009412 [Alligator mississippiensis]|uniref:Uncharacterized protein n=1 Tax=Alligator mississippiensis TaxID=8496 RepID=A0A151N7M9_ALLMI|nr:hypothetical protein Y1Q_0009412 [Alligator mississippiensis]